MEHSNRRPLLVLIGGAASKLGSGLQWEGIDILFMDTDSRTSSVRGTGEFVLVGEHLVGGEGAGGNLNLARACFKQEMERLAPMILGRPMVIIGAHVGGSTSLAGAVEFNSLLSRVGHPSLTILFRDLPGSSPSPRAAALAELLLKGPLKPGAVMDVDGDVPENGPIFGKDRLFHALRSLLMSSTESASISVPAVAWNLLREGGPQFSISSWELDPSGSGWPELPSLSPPSIVSVDVDIRASIDRIKELLGSGILSREGVHLGMNERSVRGNWLIVTVSPVEIDNTNDDRIQNAPDREGVEAVLSSLEPDMTFKHDGM